MPDFNVPKVNPLAHGGLIGSAHPASIRELYEAEIRKQQVPGSKLAHGGLIGSAHPTALDELSNPEIRG